MSTPSPITRHPPAVALDGGDPLPPSDALAPAGYGARLAWERQRAGLGVTDVAAILRLHPNQVRAIEQEDLSRLPELAYVRGFIRSYARAVNVDPAPILLDLNKKIAPPVADETAGVDYAVTQGSSRERTSALIVACAVIGLIVLGVLGFQTSQRDVPASATPSAAATSTAPAAAPATATAGAAANDLSPAPAAEAAPAATVASEAFPPADVQPATGSDASAVAPVLMLRFEGASWAEVTDARGKVLLSKLSSVGAEHALDGELPLTVVIGDANKASVEVRGETFNLLPVTRNNVARFTVK